MDENTPSSSMQLSSSNEPSQKENENSNVSDLPFNSNIELNWVTSEIIIGSATNDETFTVVAPLDRVDVDDSNSAETVIKAEKVGKIIIPIDENEIKLWEYFTEHNSSQLRCNLCSGLFLYQRNASHLLKHIEFAHEIPVLSSSNTVGVTTPTSSVNELPDVKCGIVDSSETISHRNEILENTEGRVNNAVSKLTTEMSVSKETTVSPIESEICKYFTRLDSGKMRCNLCCRVLSKKPLMIHLRSHHGDIYRSIIENATNEDDENTELNSDCSVLKFIKRNDSFEINELPHKIWEYFTKLEAPHKVQCKFCYASLKFTGHTNNMIRHLKVKHKSLVLKKGHVKRRKKNSVDERDLGSGKKMTGNSSLVLEIIQDGDDCLITGGYLYDDSDKSVLIDSSASTSHNKDRLLSVDKSTFKVEMNDDKNIKLGDEKRPINEVRNKNVSSIVHSENDSGKFALIDSSASSSHKDRLSSVDKSEVYLGSGNKADQNFVLFNENGEIINIWDYFTKLKIGKNVKCVLCSNFVVTGNHSVKSMLDHLNNKHNMTFLNRPQSKTFTVEMNDDDDKNIKLGDEKQTINEVRNKNVFSIVRSKNDKRTRKEKKFKHMRNNSSLWKNYTKLYRDKAMCNMCYKTFTYKLGQTSRLVKHLQAKHKFNWNINKQKNLIRSGTKRFYQTSKRNRERDLVWNYFTKLDDTKAECDICTSGNVISYSTESKSNLIKHLRQKHKSVLNEGQKSVKRSKTVVENDNIDDNTKPGISMKALFDYFISDNSLDNIMLENDQIICKLCSGMFLFDDLLNFEHTIRYHAESCHVTLLPEDNDTLSNCQSLETSGEFEVSSDCSYDELVAIANEIKVTRK